MRLAVRAGVCALVVMAAAVAGQEAAPEREWVERAAQLLAQPPERPRRVVLIFPLVEEGSETGEIGRGCGLIALQAMWLSSFAPDRVLDTWDFHGVPGYFVDQQLIGAGRTVTDRKIEAVRASLDTPNYATGTLKVEGGSYTAQLTFHGEHGTQQKAYGGPLDELHRLPCLIARDAVDYMGVALTEEQRQTMAESPLGSTELFEEAAERIAAFYYFDGAPGRFWKRLPARHRSRWCAFMCLRAPGYLDVFGGFRTADPTRQMEAGAAFDFERARAAFDAALHEEHSWGPMIGRLQSLCLSDPYNPAAVNLLGRAVCRAYGSGAAEVVLRRLDVVYADSFLASLHRGALLGEWAVQYAPDLSGAGMTPERLAECSRLVGWAREELERAAEEEPRCWPANALLVELAGMAGLPAEYAEERLRQVSAACPAHYEAHRSMQLYLAPWAYGSAEKMLEVSRRLAAGHPYESRMPLLILKAHEEAANWLGDVGEDAGAEGKPTARYFQQGDVWEEVEPVLQGSIQAFPHVPWLVGRYAWLAYQNGGREQVEALLPRIEEYVAEAPETLIWEFGLGQAEYRRMKRWVEGGPGPPQPAARPDWIERAFRAAAQRPDRPRRVMMIFPLTEADSPDGQIGWGRGLIALLAIWKSSFCPDRVLDTWDFSDVPWYLAHHQLLGPGRSVTEAKIEAITAALDTPNFVTGTLRVTEDSYVARIRLEGENGLWEKTHEGPRDRIHQLPCLIARDAVEYLGVELSEEQERAIATPPLSSAALFDEVAGRVADFYYGQNEYVAYWPYLDDRCGSAWTEYMHLRSAGRADAGYAYERWERVVSHEDHEGLAGCRSHLAFWAAQHGRLQTDVAADLLAGSIENDPYCACHVVYLGRLLARAGGEEDADTVGQRLYRLFGDGALAHFHSGELLVRACDDIYDWTPEATERSEGLTASLRGAGARLTRAVRAEPLCWRGYVELLEVARGLGVPQRVARTWFDRAVRVCPTDLDAYRNMQKYLQQVRPEDADSRWAFARECVATGLYGARVPVLLVSEHLRVAEELHLADRMGAPDHWEVIWGYFQRPEVWREVRPVLERTVQEHPCGYRDLTLLLQLAYRNNDRRLAGELLQKTRMQKADGTWLEFYFRPFMQEPQYRALAAWLSSEWPPLHEAVRQGRLEVVRDLLRQGADVNLRAKDGSTPLLTAVLYDSGRVLPLLLEQGADVNAADQQGRTPLHVAAERGMTALVAYLLTNGAHTDLPDAKEDTPLILAAREGHVEVTRLLLERGADMAAHGQYGATPLHQAAGWGKAPVVKLLLKKGAEPDAEASDGSTPLNWAAGWGHTEAMEALLQAGADSERTDGIGLTPLHRAALNGRTEAVEMLLATGPFLDDSLNDWGASPLVCATRSGHLLVLQLLIGAGADLEVQDNEGRTALSVAIACGQPHVLDVLLEAGAQIEASDDEGRTALHWAAQEGHADAAEVLLKHGADAQALDNAGRTPLQTAQARGHEDVVRLLQRHEAGQ